MLQTFKIMRLITWIDGAGDEEVTDIVDDNWTESEVARFLDNKYGRLVWMGYNIEPE